jgi:hypothetical protein
MRPAVKAASAPASGDKAIGAVLTGAVLTGAALTEAVMISPVSISPVLIGCTVPPHVTRFLGVSMADLTRRDNRFGT